MKPTFTFYAGDFAVGKWAAGQLYELEDVGKQQRMGYLAVLLEFAEVPEGQEAELAAEALRRVGELYYGQDQLGTVVLEHVWNQLREEFAGLSGTLVVTQGETVHVVRVGGVGVWVKQPWASGWVLPIETEQLSATGKWHAGSELVVGNAAFWRQVGQGELKKGLDEHAWSVDAVGVVLRNVEGTTKAVSSSEEAAPYKQAEKEELLSPPPGRDRTWTLPRIRVGHPQKMAHEVVAWVQRPASGKPWRKAGVWGIILLALLGALFLLGRAKKMAQVKAESVEEKQIVQLLDTFAEAKLAVGINKDEAKRQVGLTQQQLATLSDFQKKDERVLGLQTELPKIAALADGVKMPTLKELAHLELVREGVGIGGLAIDDQGALWVVDMAGSRLFRVSGNGAVEVKKGKNELGEVKIVATYPTKLFTWAATGIVQCSAAGENCTTVVPGESEWKQVTALHIWAGNIYVSDPGAGQIWKYPVTETGFGGRQDWIATTSTANSSGTTSMAIDGNVWLAGGNGGRILKLAGGNAETITIVGLSKGLGDDVEIYTSDTVANLYLLDRANKRVVVADKTGQYVEQWSDDRFGQARGIVVDEKGTKAFFGVGSVVWEADW